ncbi:MAG: BON domain-containing protein [Leptolyngbyaceae cyanobacterium bins.302]|nr:BON domain-containing protein [Leptolyngbyaceae cyanobacterium bins.302]
MGFFDRIFGGKKNEPEPAPADVPQGGAIPPERVGLNGEYDQSGLAKRVAKAFDDDAGLTDVETLWVAQTGGTVVLKGKVPSQDLLSKFVNVAEGVNGATSVDTSQVTIG